MVSASRCLRFIDNSISPANGKIASASFADEALGIAAVVLIVNVTCESPLPDATCVGLNRHVVNAGNFEQEKPTSLGNAPVFGFTSILNVAACPAATEALAGERFIVKSNVWFARAEKLTATECAIAAGSLPTALMLKLHAFETLLVTLTVNAVPEAPGTGVAGAATQLTGAPGPQVRVTAAL